MAKAKKGAPAGHTRKRAAKKTAAKKGKRTILKQSPLPGMEQVRHVTLDKLAQSVGDTRSDRLTLQASEGADCQAALDYMVAKDVMSYHHAGIEFVVRPGAYKLSVRRHKEATADGGSIEDGPETADDDEDGEDA